MKIKKTGRKQLAFPNISIHTKPDKNAGLTLLKEAMQILASSLEIIFFLTRLQQAAAQAG